MADGIDQIYVGGYVGRRVVKQTLGNKLSNEMIEFVKDLPRGSIITFFKIASKDPSGKKSILSPIRIEIIYNLFIMKNLFLLTLTFAMVQFTFAQDQTILDGGYNIIDGAYEKNVRNGEIEPEEIPGYQYVREADVMWSTKISRVINLREKINQVFYYPQQEINDRKNLIDVLMDAINEGTITPYANAYKDDEFKTPMISDAEKAMIGLEGQPVDTIKYYDDELEEEIEVIVENKFEKENVRKYIIKEEWYFDKQRSVMDVRIIGICPLILTSITDLCLSKYHSSLIIYLRTFSFSNLFSTITSISSSNSSS
jgi:gliding motility associated protien GldN